MDCGAVLEIIPSNIGSKIVLLPRGKMSNFKDFRAPKVRDAGEKQEQILTVLVYHCVEYIFGSSLTSVRNDIQTVVDNVYFWTTTS